MKKSEEKNYRQKIEAQQKEIARLRAELSDMERGLRELSSAVDAVLIETAKKYGEVQPAGSVSTSNDAPSSGEALSASGKGESGESFVLVLGAVDAKAALSEFDIRAAKSDDGMYRITVTRKATAK